jgi:hypothetical protein
MKFIQSILSDVDGQGSSKRVTLFILVFLYVTMGIASTFWGKQIDPKILDNTFYAILLLSGFNLAEKYTKRGMDKDQSAT